MTALLCITANLAGDVRVGSKAVKLRLSKSCLLCPQ